MLDGAPLQDLVDADPVGWLGADHVERFGTSPALLVKLLHAGQRLPVHLHPSRSFAQRHLDCPFGKSEAWLILDRDRADTTVYVGANRRVEVDEWAELVSAQATDTMLELLNPISVDVGDGVFVPSGSPHAIGEGLLIMELQEPTDFSILLEWDGFAFDGPNDGHLGLGFDVALAAINPRAFDGDSIDELVRRHPGEGRVTGQVLPPCADPYFELTEVRPDETGIPLAQSFGVLLVTEGHGRLILTTAPDDRLDLQRGDALVIPHGAGPLSISGDLVAYHAVPPRPGEARPTEFDQHDNE
jgi:mannose-6-phosphate isomerase